MGWNPDRLEFFSGQEGERLRLDVKEKTVVNELKAVVGQEKIPIKTLIELKDK